MGLGPMEQAQLKVLHRRKARLSIFHIILSQATKHVSNG